jgi:hypothetical protein
MMNTKRIKMLMTVLCAALMVFAAAPAAQALTYNITSDHADGVGGLGTPPFGTVTLLQNGTSVGFTVHLLSPYYFVLTGAADFQDFKFNATGVVVGDITITQNAPYTLFASTGSYNGDGTGTFGFGISGTNQPNGANGRFNSDIIFSVANATLADFTAPNAAGNIFVVDLFASNLGGLTGTGNTGAADVTPSGLQVAEPFTLLLLGFGLVGLAGVRRFKK